MCKLKETNYLKLKKLILAKIHKITGGTFKKSHFKLIFQNDFRSDLITEEKQEVNLPF